MRAVTTHPRFTLKTAPAQRSMVIYLLLGLGLFVSVVANAQTQEKRMDDLLHPDRSKTSDFAGKTFATTSSAGNKQVNVRSFSFGRAATLRSGDGAFKSRKFAGKDGFRTEAFDTKADPAGSRDAFTLKKGFDTKPVDVREAPAASKTMETKEYASAGKLFEVRGKRQDSIDELHKDKNLSIDEVREILNKPNGRPNGQRTPLGAAVALPSAP